MDFAHQTVIDIHGPSWRQWVLDNLGRGCSPKAMLFDMIKSVWSLETAETALDEGLKLLNLPCDWKVPLPRIPDADLIDIAGHTVKVLSRIASPKAALLDQLLTEDECSELIDYAFSKGLNQSGVVDSTTGKSIEHHARTSSSVFLSRAETALIDTMERRLASLTSWPIQHGEGIQVLCYQPGQQYKPHFDWFDASKPGSASHLKRGGQRVGTTVIYLATPELGGGTSFPKTGIHVSPRAGGAIFFNDVDFLGNPDQMSLHAGAPVEKGLKIVATYWQRQGPFI